VIARAGVHFDDRLSLSIQCGAKFFKGHQTRINAILRDAMLPTALRHAGGES
jgi:hypothetical protein